MTASTPLLCEGRVIHARRAATAGEFANAARNAFAYPLFFVAVPLSRWGDPTIGGRWFAFDRRTLLTQLIPLTLNAADHGPRDGTPLLPWIRVLLAREGIDRADGEVVLQTFPRVFGRVFNPVSFWFCHDHDGALRAVLAEVNNTFGERHNYLVAHADQRPINAGDTISARKVFHVSPFFPVAGEYRFSFALDAQRRRVEIDYHLAGQRVLFTAVEGAPAPFDARAARRACLRFPLLSVAVLTRIHWQALRLWLKGAFLFRKPPPPMPETSR